MPDKIILHTENLSIGYSAKKSENLIASGINLSLESGKLISIVGENGIGKSTLLRTLTGIQKPLSGNVFLRRKAINNYSVSELALELSIVLTEKLPPGNLSVYELIALGRHPYTNWIGKLDKQDLLKIELAITLTDVDHLRNKKHHEISDGQLQKVLIARAIAQDTPLIILDEPTTHLDLLHKVSLFRLLKKLSRETGKCILFSTHDIDLAIQLSDEMLVMLPGKIVQDKPQNLIDSNIFDEIFKDEDLTFDAVKGKFIFKNL